MHTEVRGDRWDRGDHGTGSFHTVDITCEVFSQPIAVVRLNILEDLRHFRVANYDIERVALCLMRLCQSFVVVDGSSNSKSSYET